MTLLKAMPVLANGSDVESERLLLPLDIPLLLRMEGCKGDVVNIEEQLWLNGTHAYRNVNMRGQVHMTRAAAFMECLQRRLESAAATDVTNMEGAMFTIDLDNGTETEKTHYGKKPKKVQRQVGAFNEADNEEVNSVVRVEWLKSCACVHRWHEEFRMVNTEMERTLISLEYRTHESEGVQDAGDSLVGEMEEDAALREGRCAYVECQAATYRALTVSFKSQWARPRASVRCPPCSADEAMEMEAKDDTEEESQVGDGAADARSVDSAIDAV
ncbi:hypothetical protein EDD85DRAFT_953520 [Armillaria nabsnona]|nr:hypothetical protein EDD85DRAFT_953520 [Armillaria nabsnona]